MLLLPLITVLAGGYGAFALYVEASVRSDLIGTIDDELGRATRSPPRPGQPESNVGGDTPVQALLDADGTSVIDAGTMPDGVLSAIIAADLPVGMHTLTVEEIDLRVLVRGGPGGQREVAALGVGTVLDSIGDLRRTLVVGGIALVAGQMALVWFITRRVTRPVTELASTARRVAAGEHGVEVRVSPGAMETEELAKDLDHMLRELRHALADQAASASDATQARETMARFLADAAHELRTPLTALRGYTELYERDMLDEPGALDRAMHRIGDESDRLERLVSSLLELARGTARSDRDHGPVDLSSVAADVVDDVRAAYPGRVLADDLVSGLVVSGDRERLHQAILNLVANACRHTPPGTTTEVVARRDDDAVVVEVIDHGGGVAPEHRERIFEPFFQADDARTNNVGSAGLGLALAAQIVGAHRGDLRVDDTPGGGATFVLTLREDADDGPGR